MSSLVPKYEEITRLVEEYSDMVLRVAFTYMKNIADAEDIVQEIWLKIVKSYPSFQNDEHEKAWIIRVTINLCKNRLKSVWYSRSEPLYDNIAVFSPEEGYVLEAVFQIPLKYRRIIFLYYYEGYSIREISNILGIKEATISSQLQRGRQRLKSKLKEDFDYETK